MAAGEREIVEGERDRAIQKWREVEFKVFLKRLARRTNSNECGLHNILEYLTIYQILFPKLFEGAKIVASLNVFF